MKISVIIPCFNEENSIIEILNKVNLQKKKFDLEIIVSDDGSKDGTIKKLEENSGLFDHLLQSKHNQGKGSAIIRAIEVATEIILFQDADLEYSPEDYEKLVKPFIKNNADVVYGTRFQGSSEHRVIYYSHRVANFIITNLVNLFKILIFLC